jgi:hypothetical protein
MADGSAKVEEVQREVVGLKAEFSNCCLKMNQDLTNLEEELAELKEEIMAMRPKPELLAQPVADVAVPPGPKAAAPAGSSLDSPPPPNVTPPQPKPAPVEVSPPPAPLERAKQFPPLVNGIIAHLTRQCGGNVHDRHIVDITSESFETETEGTNSHSGAFDNSADLAAKNAADLETGSCFLSAYRGKKANIPHTRNNWVCYDFKERRIVPTHYTIRTYGNGPGGPHMKSWLAETSANGEKWREVAGGRTALTGGA